LIIGLFFLACTKTLLAQISTFVQSINALLYSKIHIRRREEKKNER